MGYFQNRSSPNSYRQRPNLSRMASTTSNGSYRNMVQTFMHKKRFRGFFGSIRGVDDFMKLQRRAIWKCTNLGNPTCISSPPVYLHNQIGVLEFLGLQFRHWRSNFWVHRKMTSKWYQKVGYLSQNNTDFSTARNHFISKFVRIHFLEFFHFFSKMNRLISGVDLDDEKSFDPALFDVTRIPVNDFANQITLDDFEIFKRITPEEVIFRFHIFGYLDIFRCDPSRFLRDLDFITTKRFPLNEFQREFMVSNC